MSLQPQMSREVPEETARVAQAIYPKGNLFMKIRDELGDLFEDVVFTELYPQTGQHSLSPSLLALVLVMQYIADYTDRQAAEAVRDQISWKYVLGLELESQGFDFSVLSEFRKRLVENEAQAKIFNLILEKLQAKGLLKGKSKQRTDATHVLAQVRNLNRLELVGEAMRVTLNHFVQVAPEWLHEHMPVAWFDRYAERFNSWHLPKDLSQRQALMLQIGADGYQLLDWFYHASERLPKVEMKEIEALRQIWVQQFWLNADDEVQLREPNNMPKGAHLIMSPFDLEARFSRERSGKTWLGYKSHVTETCTVDAPRIITHVQTVVATTNDNQSCTPIQKALLEKSLKPDEHYLDAGYSSLTNLLDSRALDIDMFSPMRTAVNWQSQAATGFGLDTFFIDWDAQTVQCPSGKTSNVWSESYNTNAVPIIHVRFAKSDCQDCPFKVNCTKAQSRSLKLYARDYYEALAAARLREKTAEFKEKYRVRSGIEGTISMAVRDADLRHSPFIGLQKTALHALLVASALNIIRALNWLNEVPLATSRKSPLHTFAA